MAREQGTFTQSANYEVQKEGTIDARQFVDVFADLLNFTASNYIADGFPVTVRQDSIISGTTYKKGWYQFLGGAINDANNWEYMGGGETPTLQELVDAAQNISDVIIEFLGDHTLENDGSGKQLSLKGTVAIESKDGTNQLQVSDNGVRILKGGSQGSAGEALLTDGTNLYYGAYDYNNLDNLPDLSVFDNVDTFPTEGDFPAVGKADVFYIDNSTGKLYRWNGTGYSVVAGDLALGETASTAYRGDRGKIAYDHSQELHAPSNAQKNSDITKGEIEAKLTGNITSHTHTVDAYTKQEVDEIASQKQYKDLAYDTITEMLLGQGDQYENQTIRVNDASADTNLIFPTGANKVAYYKYDGVAGSPASIDDYTLISAPYATMKAWQVVRDVNYTITPALYGHDIFIDDGITTFNPNTQAYQDNFEVLLINTSGERRSISFIAKTGVTYMVNGVSYTSITFQIEIGGAIGIFRKLGTNTYIIRGQIV